MAEPKRIHILEPLIAQRIAAGEVIERPASVIRELLDNSIDAGADEIIVQVIEGGLNRITVIDNGSGISREDLPLCCTSHATSKVATLEDLYRLDTLGFRGEALYSMAASAKVTISSSFEGTAPYSIVVDNGTIGTVVPGGPSKGTRIDVEHLFSTIPARRLFLKRPSTEMTMCKNTVIEKALAFPRIAFTFYDGDNLKLTLCATERKQRILDALANDKNVIPAETQEIQDQAGRFSLYAVTSSPAYYRTDRSHIKIYVNNRLIDEYALVQAVVHAYSEMLPGGAFPYCYLFITVDPELVDFNIHPAKREAKIRNKAEIHHQIVVMIRQQIKRGIQRIRLPDHFEHSGQYNLGESSYTPPYTNNQRRDSNTHDRLSEKPIDPAWFAKAREVLKSKTSPNDFDTSSRQDIESQPTYLGQLFDLFLLAEHDHRLYIIDQHAAHERILYDEIKLHGDIQPLMIPIRFEVERDVDNFLQQNARWYADYGMHLKRTADLEWELDSIPAIWKPIERDVVRFIGSQTGNLDDLDRQLYSVIACHRAIKDGDKVDRLAGQALVNRVLAMEHPVCPHGRTFVVEISEESLRKAVGRII
ncbi:MAG: DNA mismatch repair endonuclease MutL [Sphaerochaetaceae bacterium]|jgi:DNA mismatch repair protein MutL|nr:DNA mismatch repair endonuclease MutL [Sphaerochaetaceae bacterium]NLO60012.1 DNA mismatch repair endonuclease MutL [Spirochaetales bacterium]MDD2405381.1 DNA mismatch repair endonuclease MutL [Sphaerochaetaceae bacterium]MDD4259900.1 DNA mismatch repair endonuclease MutL [Sphaerochaetaceae bacterium]MDD4763436.1 DNA mismatch repair endonuclease MutL [Sphaerochaetaceae bacterium]